MHVQLLILLMIHMTSYSSKEEINQNSTSTYSRSKYDKFTHNQIVVHENVNVIGQRDVGNCKQVQETSMNEPEK